MKSDYKVVKNIGKHNGIWYRIVQENGLYYVEYKHSAKENWTAVGELGSNSSWKKLTDVIEYVKECLFEDYNNSLIWLKNLKG